MISIVLSMLRDLCLAAGLVSLTLMVLILWREPRVNVALHAAAGAATSVAILLMSGLFSGDAVFAVRSIVVAFFLLVTAPVSAHIIAHAHEDRD